MSVVELQTLLDRSTKKYGVWNESGGKRISFGIDQPSI